jgi:trigger factor
MQVTETVSDGLKREFRIVVPAAEIQSQVTAKLQDISQQVKLPGFRPGKTPMTILKQRFGRSVMGEVLETAVNTSSQQVMEDRGLKPALQPNVEIEKFDEGSDLEFKVAVEVLPEITPMDFAQLKLERVTSDAEPEAIETALQRLGEQGQKSRKLEESRPVQQGDIAVIDFVGKLDGEPFPGGSAEAYELKVGSNTFIPGFEDQLIGASVDEPHEVRVTFPADYGAEHLAGKEAVFDVTVREIREPEPVEITDELAKTFGFETLEELRTSIKGRIEGEYNAVARGRLKRVLFDKLEEAHSFPVPQGLLDQEFNSIWNELQQQLKGPQADSVREGKSDEELETEYRKVAERRVRLGLLLAEVGRANNISVSQGDLARAVRAELARFPGQEQQVYEFFQKNPNALSRLHAPILEDKVVDYILELAEVSTRKVPPDELLKQGEDDEAAVTAAAAG